MVNVTIYFKNNPNILSFKTSTSIATFEANLVVKRKTGRIFPVDTTRGTIILDPLEVVGVVIEKS